MKIMEDIHDVCFQHNSASLGKKKEKAIVKPSKPGALSPLRALSSKRPSILGCQLNRSVHNMQGKYGTKLMVFPNLIMIIPSSHSKTVSFTQISTSISNISSISIGNLKRKANYAVACKQYLIQRNIFV
jgi:hypothetical protein